MIDHNHLLHAMLKRPNIASKETWVRQYDHEVIAQTAIKPFVGVERDGPGDAGVIAPLHGNPHGLVISCGIAPRYSDIDAGAMAAAAIDEAVRNAVCVGLDVDKMAGLDNFCWPDPIESSKHQMAVSNSLNWSEPTVNWSGFAEHTVFLV